nr:uncharacterized protein LOC110564358 isoform X2 [Meriones unguiculatus]
MFPDGWKSVRMHVDMWPGKWCGSRRWYLEHAAVPWWLPFRHSGRFGCCLKICIQDSFKAASPRWSSLTDFFRIQGFYSANAVSVHRMEVYCDQAPAGQVSIVSVTDNSRQPPACNRHGCSGFPSSQALPAGSLATKLPEVQHSCPVSVQVVLFTFSFQGREAQVKECSNLPFISVPFFNFYLKLQKSHQSHCKAQSHRPHSECFWPSPSTFTILQHLFPQIAAETSTNQGAAAPLPGTCPDLWSWSPASIRVAKKMLQRKGS